MRKTERLLIYPWDKGINTSAMPGTQDRRALTVGKNIVLRNRGSRAKRPGIRDLGFMGKNDGSLRGVADFHGVSGTQRFQKLVRVINGRVEMLENNEFLDQNISGISSLDAVSFERFANALIVGFENTRPYYYTVANGWQVLPIPSTHVDLPPRFFRVHDFSLFYAGRQDRPHTLTKSAINSISDYTLVRGAASITVNDGDGDPVGITGISPPFRGDLFVFKSGNFYRLPRTSIGYGVELVTDQVGCVAHNTIVATPNDIFWVSDRAIHSLSMTAKYGAAEESTVTYPIYEDFIDDVNWSMAKYMWATYDATLNAYLLTYASKGSPVNNKTIGFNILTREFFEWEDMDFAALTKYLDENKRIKTLVALEDGRIGVLDDEIATAFDEKVRMEIATPLLYPRGSPSNHSTFTRLKVFGRATTKDVRITVDTQIDGLSWESYEISSAGGGEGAILNNESPIGSSEIGINKNEIFTATVPLAGEGGSLKVFLTQDPPETDPDQSCEIYGLELEFDYNEDTDAKVTA